MPAKGSNLSADKSVVSRPISQQRAGQPPTSRCRRCPLAGCERLVRSQSADTDVASGGEQACSSALIDGMPISTRPLPPRRARRVCRCVWHHCCVCHLAWSARDSSSHQFAAHTDLVCLSRAVSSRASAQLVGHKRTQVPPSVDPRGASCSRPR